jgi:hypothetical protein
MPKEEVIECFPTPAADQGRNDEKRFVRTPGHMYLNMEERERARILPLE